MHILFEHSGILPVTKYGGTERLIYWLMRSLTKRGHKVSLIGHPDSQVSSIGVQLIVKKDSQQLVSELIPNDVDVVHLFYTPNYEVPKPYLATIGGNGKKGEKFHLNTVFVSQKHAENHGSKSFVDNGIDFDEYPISSEKTLAEDNLLFLAKGSWKVKNLKSCVRVCKKTHKHLHIAGGKAWSFSKYIHSYGLIGGDKKLELLKKCDALLFPVRWHEPFGLAIIEAQAMGLPVFGSPYGDLPNLITEKMGRMFECETDLLAFLKTSWKKEFDPQTIRYEAQKRFSIDVMTENYLQVYSKVIRGEPLNEQAPSWIHSYDSEELLPW